MYFLCGFEEGLKNVAIVSRSHLRGGAVPTLESLREAFRAHLQATQAAMTISPDPEGPEFVEDPEAEQELLRLYVPDRPDELEAQVNEASIREGVTKHDRVRRRSVLASLEEASFRIAEIEPNWYELFRLVVNRIFTFPVRGRGGGSTVNGVGVIWLNPPRAWQPLDLMEVLIHEFTHNLYFLDERVGMHYPDYGVLEDPGNFAVSAILRIPRRLDRTMHSLVVGTEILLARDVLSGHDIEPVAHPKSPDLVRQNLNSISSVRSIPGWEGLMTERNRRILEMCEAVNRRFSGRWAS